MCVSWAGRPLVTAITASLLLCVSGLALAQDDKFAAGEDDATGTDPRAFGPKFMPYYRYTELDNELE